MHAVIRVVSFDLEGTLVDMAFSDKVWNEGLPRLYAWKADLAFDEAKRIVLSEYARVGEDRIEWYDIGFWFKHFGLSEDPQHLINSYKGYVRLFPETIEILEKLSQNYRLVLITNSNMLFIKTLVESIAHYFVRILSTTSEFGLLKKNPEAYRKACEVLGIKPFELAHVGDRLQDDFESPRSVGVNAFLLDRCNEFKSIPSQYRVENLKEYAERLLKSQKLS